MKSQIILALLSVLFTIVQASKSDQWWGTLKPNLYFAVKEKAIE